MKTILVAPLTLLLTTIGALSADAQPKPAAPPPKPRAVASQLPGEGIVPVKEQAVKFNFGAEYKLGVRKATEVTTDTQKDAAKPITETQVAKVVREKVDELEYCWLRVPAAKRTASSAQLHLAIEAAGTVALASVEGDLPAGVAKCITAAANKWTFPSADAGCEIDHGISLNAKTDTLR